MIKKFKITALVLALLFIAQTIPVFAEESAVIVGDEVVVAVIANTCGRVTADSFAEAGNASYKLTERKIAAMIRGGAVMGDGDYINGVIPFVYNYGDLDKNVADTDTLGVDLAYLINKSAPNAQILLMKTRGVFGITLDAAVTDAYTDAVALGADIILLDTAVYAGYTDGSDLPARLHKLIKDAYAKGIYTVAPAGDGSLNGMINSWSEVTGMNYPVASLPDVSSASAPSTLAEVISVASRENMYYEAVTVTTGDGVQIGYSDTTATYSIAEDKTFSACFDGMTLEYVKVPGQGSAEDCAAVELEGKLALIERGGLTFVEKVENARNAGAAGAVIFDNIKNNAESPLMNLEGAKLPAIFVTAEDGELLIAAENKTLIITDGETGYIKNRRGGAVSSFSSRGGLGFSSPEFTAFGGLVNVMPNADGKERTVSGTIYAAANFTASLAKLIAECRANALSCTPDELIARMKNSVSPVELNGTEFSPRAQGFGDSEDLSGALTLTSALTNNGKPYINLGSLKRPVFTLSFTLTNLTDEAATYKLSASVNGDDYTGYLKDDDGYYRDIRQNGASASDSETPLFILGTPRAFTMASVTAGELMRDSLNLNIHSEGYSPLSCTLKAGESREMKLSVRIDDAAASEYAYAFENGYYIDGYIYAEDGDGVTASMPYGGYVGNFEEAPIFDDDYYGDGSVYEKTYCYTYNYDNNKRDIFTLGENSFKDGKQADKSLIAFSPDNDGHGDELYMGFTVSRSVHDVYFNIYDGDGELLYSLPNNSGLKHSYSNPTDGIRQYKALVWSGHADDNSAYTYPDGEYYFECCCTPDDGGRTQKLKMPFIVDTASPVVEDYKVEERDGKTILTVTLSDNHYIQVVRLFNAAVPAEAEFINLIETPEPTSQNVTLEFDITNNAGQLYLEASDYAFNISMTRIEINN